MKARRLDEPGVNRIFDMFDELKDKIRRIEVGGRGFLKALLTHKCFEPIVARPGLSGRQSGNDDEGHGTFRGILFGARVYHSGDLTNGTIRVYGQESQPHDSSRSKHSFELIFRT